jgi:hypothetical protein
MYNFHSTHFPLICSLMCFLKSTLAPIGLNLWSLLMGFSGKILFSVLVAVVVVLMMQRTSSYSAFRAKVDNVNKEMEYYGLPMPLQNRINQYYTYCFVHATRISSNEMYRDTFLSRNLRSEIAIHLQKDFINTVSLFRNCAQECLVALMFTLRTVIYLPEDWIIRKGEVGRHLFIIRVGIVAVLEDENHVITNLFEGIQSISFVNLPNISHINQHLHLHVYE